VACTKSSASGKNRLAKVSELVCPVCSRTATGTHYMLISCNGCRSFFRRCIALKKNYACKRAGVGRRSCYLLHGCKSCR
ncbi:hypothetical protein PMAYCL1PPCAC_32658, partial [Pristionchus mayeri]